MLVDVKMDHGPIIAQRKIDIPDWPPRGGDLDALLAREGGRLLAEIIPLWARGEIEAHEQNHDVATYSKMFKKEDGLLDLENGDPYQNLLKIRAFDCWPGTHAFFAPRSTDSTDSPRASSGQDGEKRVRVKILDAHLENGPSTKLGVNKLIIDVVKPEGKKEMPFADFQRSML